MSQPDLIRTCKVCGALATTIVRDVFELESTEGVQSSKWGKQYFFCAAHAAEFENALRTGTLSESSTR